MDIRTLVALSEAEDASVGTLLDRDDDVGKTVRGLALTAAAERTAAVLTSGSDALKAAVEKVDLVAAQREGDGDLNKAVLTAMRELDISDDLIAEASDLLTGQGKEVGPPPPILQPRPERIEDRGVDVRIVAVGVDDQTLLTELAGDRHADRHVTGARRSDRVGQNALRDPVLVGRAALDVDDQLLGTRVPGQDGALGELLGA